MVLCGSWVDVFSIALTDAICIFPFCRGGWSKDDHDHTQQKNTINRRVARHITALSSACRVKLEVNWSLRKMNKSKKKKVPTSTKHNSTYRYRMTLLHIKHRASTHITSTKTSFSNSMLSNDNEVHPHHGTFKDRVDRQTQISTR